MVKYTEESIKSLDWVEHIRLRPGMYIGKLGDGTAPDDGIYILLKEIIDNAIDEYTMGFGKKIQITVTENEVKVRDFGRGIPLGKVLDCVSKINTGAKYDSEAFKKAVGLNGVGAKAVNALSQYFKVTSIRDKQQKTVEFSQGKLLKEYEIAPTNEPNGTYVHFIPDEKIFKKFSFLHEYVSSMIWNYAYLHSGLILEYNGKTYVSQNGLADLLYQKTRSETLCYPIIHLKDQDIEVAITHNQEYGEEYYSFVNGQHTTQGGTHLQAFKEAYVKTIREFYKKDYEAADIRASIVAAISIRIQEPVFESQTKTKLGSQNITPQADSLSIRTWIQNFLKKELDDYLHKHPEVADALQKKILQSERERKEIAGIKKLAQQRAKRANLHNKKLRDCRIHLTDLKNERRLETTLFITEGDSASGSLTQARDVDTQAVFSLRGKPLNCYGMKKKVVYENEEFNLLQHALDIEEGLENLRYNRIVIATDADVDGMHIRLLMLTFFLQFFPDLVKNGHLYILETPLFRVRNKTKTIYCYSEQEKFEAIQKLGGKPEITRFKGLGEISPEEFSAFIGQSMRLSPVIITPEVTIQKLLDYYMGKNTPQRQEFIIQNLRIEKQDLNLLAAEK
ncbi:MAG: type IIA DNA topoisomerase subunit B [Bacteroidia bacterium]|nr:type IIA DNA topoisomerase subunit B [Bacteroidia bacterium]MDW8301622.1 DNA topoisomerase IV subunit B [Bacteroidia bacterium]